MIHSNAIKALSIQVILILIATLIGIFVASKLLENSLLKTALQEETHYFWEQLQVNNNHPVPNTMNLKGQIFDLNSEAIPKEYAHLPFGYHREVRKDTTRLTFASQKDNLYLILILDEKQILQLSLYFGVFPLAIALFLIYGSFWLFRFLLKKQISPVVQLAKQVNDLEIDEDFNKKLKTPKILGFANDDFYVIQDTLFSLNIRLRNFIERERDFTRNASHELRTPLSIIKGSSEFLIRFGKLEGKHLEVVNRIHQNTKKMENLIQLLLQLSREEEPLSTNQETKLNDLVKDILPELIDVIHEDKKDLIRIRLTEESSLKTVVPEQFMTMVITNLITNAIKYTQKGEIVICIKQDSISISDTGIGISDLDLKNIFTPFYRSDIARTKASTEEDNSYGLGLSIVKKICDKFSIKISVRSTLGEGTVFELFI